MKAERTERIGANVLSHKESSSHRLAGRKSRRAGGTCTGAEEPPRSFLSRDGSVARCFMQSGPRPLVDAESFFASADGEKIISTFRKDEKIFSQGDPADSLFYIQSGKVKITVVSAEGKEAVIAILGEGEFFGEGCLAGRPERTATSTAVTESVVVRMPKDEAKRLLEKEASFSALFIAHLVARNIRVEEDLINQLFNSSEKRLARALLLMANFHSENRPQPIIENVTQGTLADMVGTTRSRVSFFMNKFRKLGFIEYKTKIKVHASLLKVLLPGSPAD